MKAMSTVQIAYFSMTIFSVDELNEKLSEIIDHSLSPEQLTQIETERKESAVLDTGESVVKFMRHEYEDI